MVKIKSTILVRKRRSLRHIEKPPKDNRKPRQTIQSPKQTIQSPKILDKPKSFEHPTDLEVVPHPIIRNIHKAAPYFCVKIVFSVDFVKSKKHEKTNWY